MKGDELEYAPLYSLKERLRMAAVLGVVAVVAMWAIQTFVLPSISAVATSTTCQYYFGIADKKWLFYFLFVGIPTSGFLTGGVVFYPLAFRGLKHKQIPPPGYKVLRQTKIKRGDKANFICCILLVAPLLCVPVAIWGAGKVSEFESQDMICPTLPPQTLNT